MYSDADYHILSLYTISNNNQSVISYTLGSYVVMIQE